MGGKRSPNHQNRKKRPRTKRTRQQVEEESKSEKRSNDLNAELRRRPGAQQIEKSPGVDWEGWQEHSNRQKEKGKTLLLRDIQ